MRMSCNGCRVLRKGCNDNCSIRPCLEWIKNPDSQANATVFLAKFYGRAGLMNLINAGPTHLRPAIFRSLLYEACGRIVNPIHGSVGLMWSGSWQLCHNAVEAVLRGAPITQMAAADAAESKNGPPFKAYDIRHVSKECNFSGSSKLHRVRNRCRFKRTAGKSKRVQVSDGSVFESGREEVNGSPSHESSLSHQSEAPAAEANFDRESMASAGNGEPAHAPEPGLDSLREEEDDRRADDGEIELELTLGFEPFSRCVKTRDLAARQGVSSAGGGVGLCEIELRLDCPAS